MNEADGWRRPQETAEVSISHHIHPFPQYPSGNLTGSPANNERKRQFEGLHIIHPAQGIKENSGEAVCGGVPAEPEDKLEFGEGAGCDCSEGRFDGSEEFRPE